MPWRSAAPSEPQTGHMIVCAIGRPVLPFFVRANRRVTRGGPCHELSEREEGLESVPGFRRWNARLGLALPVYRKIGP
jgi:hypothetical protein